MDHRYLEKRETVMAEKAGCCHSCFLLLLHGPLSLHPALISEWASPQTSLLCVTSDGHKRVEIPPVDHGIDRMFLSEIG